jgi:transposase
VGKGSGNGTTRGDRKRNARRERLRGLLPRDGAVIGIDLAGDKQALAVADHDGRVLARKTVKVKAFRGQTPVTPERTCLRRPGVPRKRRLSALRSYCNRDRVVIR